MKFRPKHSTEAIQWLGDGRKREDMEKLWEFCPMAAWAGVGIFQRLTVPGPRGDVNVETGDWIVKDIDDTFFVMTDTMFKKHYEPVQETEPLAALSFLNDVAAAPEPEQREEQLTLEK